MTAVSTNVLAVALSGLIEQRSTTVTFPMMSTQSLIPKFYGGPLIRDIANSVYLDHFYAAQSNLSSGTPLPAWIDTERFYMPFAFETPRVETAAGAALGLQGILGSTIGIGAELACYELSADPSADHSFSFAPSKTTGYVDFKTSEVLSNGTKSNCELLHMQALDSNGRVAISSGELTAGASAIEVMDFRKDDGGSCSRAITAGWVRVGANNSIPSSTSTAFGARNVTHTFLACVPQLKVATFDVLVSPEGQILRSTQTSNFTSETETARYFQNSTVEDDFFYDVGFTTISVGTKTMIWHNDSFTNDWMNSLIMYKMGNNSIVNPASPVPTYDDGKRLLSEVYSLVFGILLGLNTHVFEQSPEPINTEVTVLATEQRIFLDPIMFKITIVLLSLQLIVAILYYARRPKLFLSSLPTTIASIVGFVQYSRALDDFAPGKKIEVGSGSSTGSWKEEGDGEKRYGFGRFLGTDGKTHVGIEGSRWIVPLESENPEIGKGGWWSGLRMRGKRRGGEGAGWI